MGLVTATLMAVHRLFYPETSDFGGLSGWSPPPQERCHRRLSSDRLTSQLAVGFDRWGGTATLRAVHHHYFLETRSLEGSAR